MTVRSCTVRQKRIVANKGPPCKIVSLASMVFFVDCLVKEQSSALALSDGQDQHVPLAPFGLDTSCYDPAIDPYSGHAARYIQHSKSTSFGFATTANEMAIAKHSS